jgi:hypothetical protein
MSITAARWTSGMILNILPIAITCRSFAFAPCTFCGGCEMLDGNEEDCLGNVFPPAAAVLGAGLDSMP